MLLSSMLLLLEVNMMSIMEEELSVNLIGSTIK